MSYALHVSSRHWRKASAFSSISSPEVVDPAGSVAAMEDPLPLELTEWPAITCHRFGQGQAWYLAFNIGSYFTKHGDRHIGARMLQLIDAAHPERQLITTAPRTVELTLWKQPGCTIIHLANRTVPWSLPTDAREFTEVVPLYGVQVSLPSPGLNPQVSCRGAGVTTRHDGGNLVMTIGVLTEYAALVIAMDHRD